MLVALARARLAVPAPTVRHLRRFGRQDRVGVAHRREIRRPRARVEVLENAVVARFLAELGNPYAAVGADKDGRLSIDWGVYGVPETFVVNAAGLITYKHIGPMSLDSLEKEVIPAIEKAKGG